MAVARGRLPPRYLPIAYLAFAHASLATAFGAVAANPRGVAGFFYHSRMLAIVHLVTLGWITASILGALYIVGPTALRVQFPAGRLDYAAALCVSVGIIGMVAHFWIEQFDGMAWAAGTVAAGIALAAFRLAGPLRRAPIPAAVRAHVLLAFLNVLAAATLGVLLGINKAHPFLPGYVLSSVFAHAHLAAVGWASMMVVGVASRLLPMVLPAEMPRGPRLWATAVLLQSGVTGLFVSLLLRARFTWVFAVLIAGGFAMFISQAVWMMRHPRPRPPALVSPDPAVLHAGAAMLCLATACVIGVWLTIAPESARWLQIAAAYGVLGLVGFLAQIVVGMEGRLLPLFAWYWAMATSGGRAVAAPHQMPWRPGQYLVFFLWLLGVPALAFGMAAGAVPFVATAGWALLAATLLDSAQAAIILRHAFRRP